jgi:hypothetical protein
MAVALGKHREKGGNNTQTLHLQQWFRGQMNAMEACLGVPTIVIPSILMQLSVPAAAEMLAAALVQAGACRRRPAGVTTLLCAASVFQQYLLWLCWVTLDVARPCWRAELDMH